MCRRAAIWLTTDLSTENAAGDALPVLPCRFNDTRGTRLQCQRASPKTAIWYGQLDPVWCPAFCLAYDLTVAIMMVWLLRRRPGLARELWQTGT
jgi:hypothetical protein